MSERDQVIADQSMMADGETQIEVIEADSLVEEVSIDGMCGVY